MIIEFADPGYNWGFVWWPLVAVVVTVTAFIFASRTREVNWDMGHWVPSLLGPIAIVSIVMTPVFAWGVQHTDYSIRVGIQKAIALADQGFESIYLDGNSFTAATEDGQYFRGVLVDLRPESGYAYQVLELTGTEK